MRDLRLPTSPAFWRSPLRGPVLTSVLGAVLLVGMPVLFLTGLLSYAAYNPDLAAVNDKTPDKGLLGFYLFSWPTDPPWLYRLNQGVHVTLGITLVPVLLAKLWSVVPKLFALPPVRSLTHGLERLSLLLLVGGALFQFATGLLNIQLDYVFPGSFYRLHFYGAWVFLAGLAAHVVLRAPVALRTLRELRAERPQRRGTWREEAAGPEAGPGPGPVPGPGKEDAPGQVPGPEKEDEPGQEAAPGPVPGPGKGDERSPAAPGEAGPEPATPREPGPGPGPRGPAAPPEPEPEPAGPPAAQAETAPPPKAGPGPAGPPPAEAEAAPPPEPDPKPDRDAPTVSRRGALAFVGGASLLLFVTTVGRNSDALRATAVLAPHGGPEPGRGPGAFQINKTAAYAEIRPAEVRDEMWRLSVTGPAGTVRLRRTDLLELPLHRASLPIACVEGWSTSDQDWRGVRLRDLAALAGHDPDDPPGVLVTSLQRRGAFRQAALRDNQVLDPLSLLALEVNGAPLTADHGYPARVIVPAAPGVLNTKWVTALSFGDAALRDGGRS